MPSKQSRSRSHVRPTSEGFVEVPVGLKGIALWSTRVGLLDVDALLQQTAGAPEGEHRHVGRIATDGDGDQGGPDAWSGRVDIVPGPAHVSLGVAMEIGRFEAEGIAGDIPRRDIERAAERE